LFTTRSVPGIVWTLLSAVLAILIGVFLVWQPFTGVATLTLALAAFFAANGIVQILTSLDHRQLFPRSWLWTAISGVADLILAGIIIAGWPGSVAWALGLLIGINLFMSGVALVMTAIACRSVSDASETAAPHDLNPALAAKTGDYKHHFKLARRSLRSFGARQGRSSEHG
jgi:uncharacterized membrane protein HdeD (DUF308 family)